jgi:hypothetical protein
MRVPSEISIKPKELKIGWEAHKESITYNDGTDEDLYVFSCFFTRNLYKETHVVTVHIVQLTIDH